ncbi:MAG TPA: crotonase/enoyl-CoA hydratase family protein [Hyphomicrobiaceae bacterium]|nr:crotonase/enoyl-CoA hydratase family protein [Hyphomicrobiaceae bacterium]
MQQDISITIESGVQTLRFTRPEKKNALTAAMYTAMNAALEMGDASEDVAAHLIIGSGGTFTAGSDVGEFLERSRSNVDLTLPIVQFIRRLPLVRKPMIAAVDGPAVGIGTTMLLHCDLVYATPQASFRTPFLDLGLVPEAGSSLLAPRLFGYQRAFELLALGEPFSAERAREAGLIDAIVPAEALEATARKAASGLAAKPPEALAATRALMRGDPQAVRARIDEEVRIFAERLASPEAREAFNAFLEKRPADFSRARSKD